MKHVFRYAAVLLSASIVVGSTVPGTAQDRDTALVVGTLRHDGLLQPWAVFVDSTFQPVYGGHPSYRVLRTGRSWVPRSIVDSIRIWHVAKGEGWLEVTSTGKLSHVEDTCMESGVGYRTSMKPSGEPFNCPPWRYGIAFTERVPNAVFSRLPESELSQHKSLVDSAMVDSLRFRFGKQLSMRDGGVLPSGAKDRYRLWPDSLRDRNLETLINAVQADRMFFRPVVATLENVTVEYSEPYVEVDGVGSASITAWVLRKGAEMHLSAYVNLGIPKEGPGTPEPMTLIRYDGRLFILGEVWYWEGSDTAIWEIRDGSVELLLIH